MPLTPVQTAFADNPPDPAARWDGLYRAGCHPWDRAGPSLALADVLAQRGDLVPAPHDPPEQPSMALVPGCGRGHDARLLARLGYDVWALDVSQTAIDLAKSLEDESKSETGTEARPAGQIHYLVADFFDKSWSGDRTFDLIFDYTFLCALPPDMRPAWSARISSLLAPRTGRLICLEFPSGKPLSEKGPPWGVTPELYEALLGHPGETVEYATAEDGSVSVVVPPATALPAGRVEVQRLALVKPTRTHQAGMDPDGSVRDFISIWSR